MTVILSIAAWVVAGLVFIPAAFFALEIMASFVPGRRRSARARPERIVLLVPAHNEGENMRATLQCLHAELGPNDRLLVVADNCSDDTAAVAQSEGAEVVIRNDPARRGKGYALQFGLDHLRADPPDCVVFFDADCTIDEGGPARLAALADAHQRPAQALYLMNAPDGADARLRVAAFAWILINQARMGGLSNLADICRFTGLGLAAPWTLLRDLDFASSALAEDFAISFAMLSRGAPPLFAPEILAQSAFPTGDAAHRGQRARWERGSLDVMTRFALPQLLRARSWRALAFAMDGLIPPIALFAGFALVGLGLTALAAPIIGAGPLALAMAACLLFVGAIALGWIGYGRAALPLRALSGLAPFLLQKFSIHGAAGRASSREWVRTDREGANAVSEKEAKGAGDGLS